MSDVRGWQVSFYYPWRCVRLRLTFLTRTVGWLAAAGILTVWASGVSAAVPRHHYVGEASCGSCHEFEHNRWKAGPHGGAHQSLSATQLRDVKCNSCHATYAGEPESPLREPFLGVQCESCHGPGKYYQAKFIMKDRVLARALGLVDVPSQQCARCHTQGTPAVDPFDYDQLWPRISHGADAKAAWEARLEAQRLAAEAAASRMGDGASEGDMDDKADGASRSGEAGSVGSPEEGRGARREQPSSAGRKPKRR